MRFVIRLVNEVSLKYSFLKEGLLFIMNRMSEHKFSDYFLCFDGIFFKFGGRNSSVLGWSFIEAMTSLNATETGNLHGCHFFEGCHP